MSERVFVPIQGSNIVNEGQAAQEAAPQSAAQPAQGSRFVNGIYQASKDRYAGSLHTLSARLRQSLARQQPETEPVARASTPTPAPPPQVSQPAPSADYTAMQQEIAALRQQVANFTQNPYSVEQYGGGSQQQGGQYGDRPDPAQFDFYNPQDEAEYHQANNRYIQQEVQRGVEADRTARQQSAAMDEITRQCTAVREKYGRDANYDEAANAAKLIHLNAGGELTVEQAYLQASREIEARSGQRGRTYLPPELRSGRHPNGKGRMPGLGAIMEYNNQTGRAGQTKRGR